MSSWLILSPTRPKRQPGRLRVRALAVQCDVADLGSVEQLAERAWSHFGHVDLLFNNAGVAGGGPLLDSTANELHWLFGVNVFGV